MVNLEEFIIDQNRIDRISDDEILNKQLLTGKPLQSLFGYSDETMIEFYEMAKEVFEQNRFDDAVNCFVFLTTINPYIPEFWIGLGMAYHKGQHYDRAIVAYNVTRKLDGTKIFHHIITMQCYLDVRDYQGAIDVLVEAEKSAELIDDKQDQQQFVKDIDAARRFVKIKQREG